MNGMQPVSSKTRCSTPILGFYSQKINNSLSHVKTYLPQFIENPHLQDSIHAGIHLDQRRGRRIALALLFTELLKFALRKNFLVKLAKSKISCDRTVIQLSYYFRNLKRFQTFEHLNDSALKSVHCPIVLNLNYLGLEYFPQIQKTNKINSQQLFWISFTKNNFLFKKDATFFSKGCFKCS